MSTSEDNDLRQLYNQELPDRYTPRYRGYTVQTPNSSNVQDMYVIEDDNRIVELFEHDWMQHKDYDVFKAVIDTYIDRYETRDR